MTNGSIFLTTVSTIWLLGITPAAGQTTAYTATPLGTLPGGSSAWAQDLDASGQVVGGSEIGMGGYVHAFRSKRAAMADLGTLPGDGVQSSAAAISPTGGRVVGWSDTGDAMHAFLWQDGTMFDIHTLGVWSFAHGVNDAGQVVGEFVTETDGTSHAFLWQNGVMTDLGTLGGSDSAALGINVKGDIVGYYITEGTQRPFIWRQGVMTDLGTLGASGYASAINDAGQVVGSSDAASGYCLFDDGSWLPDYHAVLWENGAIRDLGNLGCGRPTFATGINNLGVVVGGIDTWIDGSDLAAYSAFRNACGVMKDLNDLLPGMGWSSATSINDQGQIAANGAGGAYRLDPPIVGPLRPGCGAAPQRPQRRQRLIS